MKAQGEEPENPGSWDGRHYQTPLEVSTALARQPDIHAVSRALLCCDPESCRRLKPSQV